MLIALMQNGNHAPEVRGKAVKKSKVWITLQPDLHPAAAQGRNGSTPAEAATSASSLRAVQSRQSAIGQSQSLKAFQDSSKLAFRKVGICVPDPFIAA